MAMAGPTPPPPRRPGPRWAGQVRRPRFTRAPGREHRVRRLGHPVLQARQVAHVPPWGRRDHGGGRRFGVGVGGGVAGGFSPTAK